MNVVMDGLAVLSYQAWTVFSILIMVVWGQIVFIFLLKKISKNQLTNSDYISLGMAGWILPVFLLSVLIFVGEMLFGKIAGTLLSVLALVALPFILFRWKLDRTSLPAGFAFVFALVISIVLRLAFLKNMVLPAYFDSAEHYRIIKYFVGLYELPVNDLPLTNYYHVGFHFLSATISDIFHLGIVDTMLVLGQVILAVLPLSLFFIVKQETGSSAVAAFACLLAGFGWHMPSHVMDWGKYPALLSLVGIHFVLNIGCLMYRNDRFKFERHALYWLLSFGILVSTLVHTRSLIVFVFMGASLLLTVLQKRLPTFPRRLVFSILLLILTVEVAFVQNSSLLALLFGTYSGRDIFITGLVLFLFIFSAYIFTDLTFFFLAAFSLMLAGLFLPVTGWLGYGSLTLLDRPYVQMLIYLPLSVFGGLGLAGLNRSMQRFSFRLKPSPHWVAFLFFGFVILNAVVNYDFYPSDCCQIVSYDDLATLQWMDNTLSPDANILIASTDLIVTSLEAADTLAGVDGGIWIAPMISRRIIPARGNLKFDQLEVHAEICRRGADYIYVGGMPQSFDGHQLEMIKDWYQVVFSLPRAKVYQLIGCP
ncbi:MAG: hypothetical protein IH588_04430 [Anaerolineales bacterium]|nr:hypothetical protein [Anaerolineales bacterium]